MTYLKEIVKENVNINIYMLVNKIRINQLINSIKNYFRRFCCCCCC